ncbi:hypothetical protein JW848_09695 [Candidatus Bipolaricaulota bacterium]|nr:hypothetical protein [Candidatus Bipolaricaulota bacterium]
MKPRIGIRIEDMYAWERRTPLTPEDARYLRTEEGLEIVVQSSAKRAYTDDEYRAAGIPVVESLSDCPLIVGIKEIPNEILESDKSYLYFSHTIKGQPYNMPMLRRLLDLGSTLIDYERIVDEQGRRLIFFGNFAGLAGMIDTLWALGQRLEHRGIRSPFSDVRRALAYRDLEEAKRDISQIGDRIRIDGLPAEIGPLVIGVAGYGNVSKGAQEILDLLPIERIEPEELSGIHASPRLSPFVIGKTVFEERHMATPIDPHQPFDLETYYHHPEVFRGRFETFLDELDVLVNCIYWEPRYPRLVTRAYLRERLESGDLRLQVIGDITCDIEGSIESTVRATEPDNPVYVFDPRSGEAHDGVEGEGPVVMAVEILPTELPRESSAFFSRILAGLLPGLARADFKKPIEQSGLPPELERAVIVYRGRLTPGYTYLDEHLRQHGTSAKEGVS